MYAAGRRDKWRMCRDCSKNHRSISLIKRDEPISNERTGSRAQRTHPVVIVIRGRDIATSRCAFGLGSSTGDLACSLRTSYLPSHGRCVDDGSGRAAPRNSRDCPSIARALASARRAIPRSACEVSLARRASSGGCPAALARCHAPRCAPAGCRTS